MMNSAGRLSPIARLVAVSAAAATLISSAPIASAAPAPSTNPPDLTVSVTASPSPTVAHLGTHTYVLLVNNSTWSGRMRVPGINLLNVRVHLTYNFSDERLVSFQDNSGAGFLCYNAAESIGMDIRCVNGDVPSNTTVQITLVTQAPSTVGTFAPVAMVDPYNAIAESNESNNTATIAFSTT
jgi:ABC-type transport system substrate-binding protein